MIRLIYKTELLAIFLYGVFSGHAIELAYNDRQESHTIQVLLTMPMKELAEVQVRI